MMTLREWFAQAPPPMSRYRFAKEVGITASYVTRLCRPNPPWPNRELVRRIAAVTQDRVTVSDWGVAPAQMDWIESPPLVPMAAPPARPAPKPKVEPRPRPPVYVEAKLKHKRFVSIAYFALEMMGKTSKGWFYSHRNDPGFPKRFYLPGSAHRPVLSFDECVAFQNKATTEPPWQPRRSGFQPAATNNDYHD